MDQKSMSLEQTANEFVATLSGEERPRAQQELARFIRWYGNGRPLSEIKPPELERFAESLGGSVPAPLERLEPVKAFFAFAKKRGWTGTNLGVHLRLKKTVVKSETTSARHGHRVKLTPEGHARLETELERLKAERPRIAEELRKAMADKDFRENAPLDAARDHQAHVEARIREIEATLRAGDIVSQEEAGDGKPKAKLGSKMVLRDLTYDEEVRLTLVGAREANPSKGMFSVVSPTGSQLVGREPGEVVEVQAPAGTLRYRIESVEG